MNGPIILKKYRYCLWLDKFKAFGLAVFAWAFVLFVIYGAFIALFLSPLFNGLLDLRSPVDREAIVWVYLAIFFMGGFMTISFGGFILRGMFDWIESWYIVKSADPGNFTCKSIRIRGWDHWYVIFKWGFDRSDRILVFDGFEGRRYFAYDNRARNWHYDDYKPPKQYRFPTIAKNNGQNPHF